MQRLRNIWQDLMEWNALPGSRLMEYILIGVYSSVAILSLVIGLTAKAGTLFGRAVEDASHAARPEMKALLKQFIVAGADFGDGASLLIIAVAIVYWSRRTKAAQPEQLASTAPQGPPFLL
ncbi:MAG TPA: hypothetical protein VGP62_18855 [Bryobacteraceae bacterium]|jgi:hypothetical protein|nr:hypothetical protein [Bryobacteraceae bacterium]